NQKYFDYLKLSISVAFLFYLIKYRVNEMQRFQKAPSQCLYLFGWSAAMEAFPFLQWINYGGYKGAMKSTGRDLDSVFRSWVQDHRQRKLSADAGDHEDFIDVMISSLEGMEFPGYDHDTIIKATCQYDKKLSSLDIFCYGIFSLLDGFQILRRLYGSKWYRHNHDHPNFGPIFAVE
ncbi:hypothetical protein IFM89_034440, partial [Coptis chinensis]